LFHVRAVRRSAVAPTLLALLFGLVLTGSGFVARPAAVLAQGTPDAGPTATPAPTVVALDGAVAYLLDQQAENGGFVGFSGEPDPGTTTDAVYALRAAALRGIETEAALEAASEYLEETGGAYAAAGPGQAAKLALAAIAAGRDPADFAGLDLLAAATSPLATPVAGSPAATPAVPGIYGDDLYDHALVLLALAAAGEEIDPAAIEALRGAQGEDGSWAFDGSTAPGAGDSNTTALVVQALAATGNGDDPMVAAALDYLRSVQTTNGQFAFQAAEPLVADANSTALAVQAILAAGQDPGSAEEWGNALRGLAAFQNVGGAFRYQDAEASDNLLATLQAVPALAGVPLPVAVGCEAAATPVALVEVPCVELDAAA
jgi:hypothetical protein